VSYIDFGHWDLNSSGFINSPAQGVQSLTPLRLSQERELSPATTRGSTLTPQLARRTLPFRHSTSPIQEDVRFASPELTYPDSPVQRFQVSDVWSEIAASVSQSPILTPTARSASVPAVPLSPVSRPPSPHRFPHAPPSPIDSPINWDNLSPAVQVIAAEWEGINLRQQPGYDAPAPPSHISSPDPITPPGERAEEAALDLAQELAEDRENRPPAPIFRCPDCTFCHPDVHPHQYIEFFTNRGDEWRTREEFNAPDISALIPATALAANPPQFPGVTLFRFKNPHFFTLYPTAHYRAVEIGVPPLYICSKAIRVQPTLSVPLGSIKYNFKDGIGGAFTQIPRPARNIYHGKLVILEVHDFLDGRVISTYRHLSFREHLGRELIFIVDQFYHFEDAAKIHPILLSYTLSPRLPADPLAFISTYHDTEPC
jgi:hypothetical protein